MIRVRTTHINDDHSNLWIPLNIQDTATTQYCLLHMHIIPLPTSTTTRKRAKKRKGTHDAHAHLLACLLLPLHLPRLDFAFLMFHVDAHVPLLFFHIMMYSTFFFLSHALYYNV